MLPRVLIAKRQGFHTTDSRPASHDGLPTPQQAEELMENWEPERKAARRKCSKALAPILDIIRKNAAHASLKAVDASRECPA